MTAPTHPEPRPDDEGRETMLDSQDVLTVAHRLTDLLRHDHESGDFGRALADRVVLADAIVSKLTTAALTPHPAPLGATMDGRPLCRCGCSWQQHEPGTQAIVACHAYRPWSAPLGATDEGLLTAIREHCRVVYYPPNAEYPIEHAPLAGKDSWDELRAALQAGPR